MGVSITLMRRWGGRVYYLNEEMGWVCPVKDFATPRVRKSNTATRPSLQPIASSVPLRLNEHVRASLPQSKTLSQFSGNP